MSVRVFGRLGGVDILEATLAAGGIEARIIGWGAALRSLVVPDRDGRPRQCVLGLETVEDYLAYSASFGAVVGRYANRIGGARFVEGGRVVHLTANEGRNTLHGGRRGFGRRPWTLVAHDEHRAHFALVSEDGDEGWPGRLHAFASYEIVAPGTLRMSLGAVADAPTAVNLTTHNYYNLDGTADARDHVLRVSADLALRTDAGLVPTGEIAPVAGTPLDFRAARPVRPAEPFDLDATFVLRREPVTEHRLAHAATLSSDASGIGLELWTTEPGLQVYDGRRIAVPVSGIGGEPYGACAGIALEPQRFPDAPNHAHFPSAVLLPGHVSRQVSEIRLSATER